MKLELKEPELWLVLEALDSYRYWQLSDEKYRNSGYVTAPGSDDDDAAEEIERVDELEAKLEKVLKEHDDRKR